VLTSDKTVSPANAWPTLIADRSRLGRKKSRQKQAFKEEGIEIGGEKDWKFSTKKLS